jgi:hypothetical protein
MLVKAWRYSARTLGVVRVKVAPGTRENDIMCQVSAELARLSATTVKPLNSAKRVIMFYRLMTFGGRPTVVLHVSERTQTGAVTGRSALLMLSGQVQCAA